jgi:hypothetical protein
MVKAGLVSDGEARTTFEEVIADCGLQVLDGEKAEIRTRLQGIIGRWHTEIGVHQDSDSRLHVKHVQTHLRTIAGHLEEIEQVLRSRETGALCHVHDIEVANQLVGMLQRNPEVLRLAGVQCERPAREEPGANRELAAADEFLSDFCNRMASVAHACRIAAQDLGHIEAEPGPNADWFLDFTRLMAFVAHRNSIKTTPSIDPRTKKPGPFVVLAGRFEQLLPRQMRSNSSEALAKRLARALKQL